MRLGDEIPALGKPESADGALAPVPRQLVTAVRVIARKISTPQMLGVRRSAIAVSVGATGRLRLAKLVAPTALQ
jgi:hypothetical protein